MIRFLSFVLILFFTQVGIAADLGRLGAELVLNSSKRSLAQRINWTSEEPRWVMTLFERPGVITRNTAPFFLSGLGAENLNLLSRRLGVANGEKPSAEWVNFVITPREFLLALQQMGSEEDRRRLICLFVRILREKFDEIGTLLPSGGSFKFVLRRDRQPLLTRSAFQKMRDLEAAISEAALSLEMNVSASDIRDLTELNALLADLPEAAFGEDDRSNAIEDAKLFGIRSVAARERLIRAGYSRREIEAMAVSGEFSDFSPALLEPKVQTQRRKRLATLTNSGLIGSDIDAIRADVDEKFGTIRLHHAAGIMPMGAEALVVALHGSGTTLSQSSSMRLVIRFLGEPKNGKRSPMIRRIQELPKFTPVGVEAIDLPGHGVGPSFLDLCDRRQVTTWLGEYLKAEKTKFPGKPLIVYARSSSAALISLVNRKYPGLVDGLIFVSPTLPGHRKIIERNTEILRRQIRTVDAAQIDEPTLTWANELLNEVAWEHEDFGNVPLLILTGGKDWEMQDEEREFYRELARRVSSVRYAELPHSGHEPFLPSSRDDAGVEGVLEAARQLETFIHDVVNATRVRF